MNRRPPLKNLAVGRIDYAAAGDTHGAKIIAEHQLQDKVVKLFNFNTSDYYPFATNKWMRQASLYFRRNSKK